jgi:hypothetical protein
MGGENKSVTSRRSFRVHTRGSGATFRFLDQRSFLGQAQ